MVQRLNATPESCSNVTTLQRTAYQNTTRRKFSSQQRTGAPVAHMKASVLGETAISVACGVASGTKNGAARASAMVKCGARYGVSEMIFSPSQVPGARECESILPRQRQHAASWRWRHARQHHARRRQAQRARRRVGEAQVEFSVCSALQRSARYRCHHAPARQCKTFRVTCAKSEYPCVNA